MQSPGVVTASLRYIERNCLRKLTLQEVAEAVGRTPSYVTTALRQATGRSAVAWVTAYRLAEAQRLLRHSDERVDVVAERVGYVDANHFIRTFRRAFGLTPAARRVARSASGRGLAGPGAEREVQHVGGVGALAFLGESLFGRVDVHLGRGGHPVRHDAGQHRAHDETDGIRLRTSLQARLGPHVLDLELELGRAKHGSEPGLRART